MANIQQVQLTDTFPTWRQRLNEAAQELNLNVPKNNYSGSGAPSVTDDVNTGYSVGSLWIDTVNNDTYRCLDNTAGAAVWKLTSLEISDLGSIAIQNANNVAITGGTANNIYSTNVVAIRSLLVNPEKQDGLSLIMPYYKYPTDVYNNAEVKALVDTIKANQDVRCRIVINPASGPGTTTDSNYAELIKLLLGAGAEVLGYVDTNYGNTQQGTIESDINQWLTLYPYITGIYLDRLPWLDDSGSDGTSIRQDLIDMYSAITTNTHQKGLPMVMGYAGSEVGSVYYSQNMVDVVVIYGSNVAPTEADLEGYYAGGHSSYSKFRKGGMVWEQASIDGVTFKELLDRVGHVLITDLATAAPFAGVPSYLDELLKMLHVWPHYGTYGFDVDSISGVALDKLETPGAAIIQETGNFEASPNIEYLIDMQKAYGNQLVWPARGIKNGEAFTLTDMNDTWKIQSPILVPWTKPLLEQKIDNPSPAISDQFGYSVSISADGTRCIIGAPYDDTGATDSGSAYIYVLNTITNTWSLEQTINNPSPAATDFFGYSVSINADGTRCIIGAPYDDTGATDAGSAYVYVRSGSTWTLEQTINNPSPVASDNFGHGVSINADGTRCIIGAPFDDTGATDAGSAYVYVRSGSTWTLEQTINNPSPAAGDYFGRLVSINADGTRCVIGTRGKDTGATDAGSAYIYVRSGSTWTLEQTINNPSPAAGDYFGDSVSINADGTRCIIGAPLDDTGATDAGSAYVYVRSGSTWTLEQEINNPSPVAGDYFGYSVAINADGTRCIIGAYRDDTGATDAGSAYVYVRFGSNWILEQQILNPSPVAGDGFGNAVAINSNGTRFVISAYNDNTGATNTGAAYTYESQLYKIDGRTEAIELREQSKKCLVENNNWEEIIEIDDPHSETTAYFGDSVAFSKTGERFIISSQLEPVNGISSVGSVYIYTKDGLKWKLEQKIEKPNPVLGDYFGASCDIDASGTRCVIGSEGDDTAGSGKGSIYIYIYNTATNTWSLEQQIVNPDPTNTSGFGRPVIINSDGSKIYASCTTGEKVFVFNRSGSTWSLIQTISSPYANIGFGGALAVDKDGNRCVIGAVGNNISGTTNSGSAFIYVYDGNSFILEQQIDNPYPANYDVFGKDLALNYDGNCCLIGAYNNSASGGAVYFYKRSGSTWTLIQEIQNPLGATNGSYFGYSISITPDNNRLVVGAYFDATSTGGTGSVYIYKFNENYFELEKSFTSTVSNSRLGYDVSIAGNGRIVASEQYRKHPRVYELPNKESSYQFRLIDNKIGLKPKKR